MINVATSMEGLSQFAATVVKDEIFVFGLYHFSNFILFIKLFNNSGGLYEQLHGDIESDNVFYLTDFNWVPYPTKLQGGYRHGFQLVKSGQCLFCSRAIDPNILLDNRIVLIGGRDDAENEKPVEVWTSLGWRQFRVELLDLTHYEWINYPNSFAVGKFDFNQAEL